MVRCPGGRHRPENSLGQSVFVHYSGAVRIIFIRHGQTDSNVGHLLDTGYPGAPLNETGLAQAAGLPDRLRDEPIEVVVTSDITRARQTGEPLAADKAVPLITEPGFREIFAGDWEMATEWQGYIDTIASWLTDPTSSMPNGENGVGFIQRYDEAIARLESYDCVAIVSHGAALRTWLGYRGQVTLDGDPRWQLHNTDTVVVEGTPSDWKILEWGDTPIP